MGLWDSVSSAIGSTKDSQPGYTSRRSSLERKASYGYSAVNSAEGTDSVPWSPADDDPHNSFPPRGPREEYRKGGAEGQWRPAPRRILALLLAFAILLIATTTYSDSLPASLQLSPHGETIIHIAASLSHQVLAPSSSKVKTKPTPTPTTTVAAAIVSVAPTTSSLPSSTSPSQTPAEAFVLVAPSSSASSTPLLPTWDTRVGPRQFPNLYRRDTSGCNVSQLVDSVGRALIDPDGASRFPYKARKGGDVNAVVLEDFKFSYSLDECPQPHIFTPAEACDLLGAFGGIYNRGDSLMRQFTQGLYLLITNSFDLVADHHDECSGNELFTNGYECKFHSVYDSSKLEHLCETEPYVIYDQVWKFVSDPPMSNSFFPPPTTSSSLAPRAVDHLKLAKAQAKAFALSQQADSDTKKKMQTKPKKQKPQTKKPPKDDEEHVSPLPQQQYTSFIASLPPSRQILSPILIQSTGIHYRYRTNTTLAHHILPFNTATSSLLPLPITFFQGYPAPGENKPEKFKEFQGRDATRSYNEGVKGVLEEVNEGREVGEGGWGFVDWFNSTDGALSYDGTHYSYQVAMERAQVFLNLLDIVWGDIVEHGGLVEGGSLSVTAEEEQEEEEEEEEIAVEDGSDDGGGHA